MSSYLNFYLVPKEREGDTIEPKPMRFVSYSRANEIYQRFRDIGVVWCGSESDQYTKITSEDCERVVDDIKDDITRAEKRVENQTDLLSKLSNLNTGIIDEYAEDIYSTKEYIEELKEELTEARGILSWVSNLEFSDFEKVLANVD